VAATIEERVAYLEGKVEEHSKAWSDLKEMMNNHDAKMIAFEQRIDRRFEAIDRRFEAIDRRFESIDKRFESIDRRFESIDKRFEAIDRRFEAIDRRFESLERRIDSLDQKFSRYFLWIIGIQVSIFLAILATVLK